MTARELVDRVAALSDAATEGPWVPLMRMTYTAVYAGHRLGLVADSVKDADADLIAEGRTLLPVLAAVVRDILDRHQPDEVGWCLGCDRGEDGEPLDRECPERAALERIVRKAGL